MKHRLFGFFGTAAMLALFVVPSFSQDQTLRSAAGDKWVISAKAGAVNYIEGPVSVIRTSGRSGLLLRKDTIDIGDIVSTGADSRAEVLLNPGSYLRVAPNTTFQFKTTQLEDLQIQVEKGSVMLEVFADNDFTVTVFTPSEKYSLIKTGVYRVDVAADGTARLEVWKGKAEVGDSVVKGGKAITSDEGDVAVVKFDRDERDDFEAWSKTRAKELAKATNSLRDRTLRTSLMNSFIGGRWNMYNSFGLWVYDASFGRHCFLPFGYGWRSPYGYGFGADIWWYRLPPIVFQPPAYRPPTSGTPPTGDPTARRPIRGGDRGDGSPGYRRPPVGDVAKAPPFSAIQGKESTGPKIGRGIMRDVDAGFDGPRRSGSPVFSPPVSAPSTPSAPASSPAPIRGAGGGRRVNP